MHDPVAIALVLAAVAGRRRLGVAATARVRLVLLKRLGEAVVSADYDGAALEAVLRAEVA